jgi:hypothetical protein
MRDTRAFSSLGGYKPSTYELSGLGDPATDQCCAADGKHVSVLGVSPLMGRAFTQQEDENMQQVVLLSYQTWHSRFHGDAHILGQKILLDRKPYEIIGVMPREFEFPLVPGQLNRSELWVPMSFTQAELIQGAGNWSYYMVGRLKPGVTPAQAQQDAADAAQEIMRNFPPALSSRRIHPAVQPLDEAPSRRLGRWSARSFLPSPWFCLSPAPILRAVAGARHPSPARDLGAPRARRSHGCSSPIPGRGAAAQYLRRVTGTGTGIVAVTVGVSFLPETLPRISSIGLELAGSRFRARIGCAHRPALRDDSRFAAARTGVNEALKEGGRTGTAGGGHARLRSALVVAELAVALVLLTASGLLLRSFEKMRSVGLGFRTDHTLTAAYSLPRQQYSTQAAIDGFNQALRTRLEQLPGVQAVGVTNMLPAAPTPSSRAHSPRGLRSTQGRGVESGMDTAGDGQLLPGAGHSGHPRSRLHSGRPRRRSAGRHRQPHAGRALLAGTRPYRQTPAPRSSGSKLTVADRGGRNRRCQTTGGRCAYRRAVLHSLSQTKADAGSFAPPGMLTGNGGSIVVRGQLPPEQMAESLRAVVHSIDPQLPLTQVESMDRVVSEGQAPRRFNTALISAFAGAAVLLAVLGIYSVIAFSTALRSQEMAIRLALGSQRSSVMRLILVSGAKLGLAGCGIGAIAAVFATRLLRSLLFQVDALDPAVLVLATLSLFLLALVASIIPTFGPHSSDFCTLPAAS